MKHYMLQISYSQSAYETMIKKPQNRVEAVSKVIQNLGGKLGGFWFSFGDYDLVGMMEMPDDVSAAAFAMAISAGGACSDVKTTPLLSVEDAMSAMKKAGRCGYKPVVKKK